MQRGRASLDRHKPTRGPTASTPSPARADFDLAEAQSGTTVERVPTADTAKHYYVPRSDPGMIAKLLMLPGFALVNSGMGAYALLKKLPEIMRDPLSHPQETLDLAGLAIGAGWKGGLPKGATGVGMTRKGGKPLTEAALTPDSLASALRSLQAPGQPRELVSISALRDKLNNPPGFDDEIIRLAREGKVVLHEHDFASSLSDAQRAKLVSIENPRAHWGGRSYYTGIAPKEDFAAAAPAAPPAPQSPAPRKSKSTFRSRTQ